MKKFVGYRFDLLKHFLNQHEASLPPNAADATAKKNRQCLQHEARAEPTNLFSSTCQHLVWEVMFMWTVASCPVL